MKNKTKSSSNSKTRSKHINSIFSNTTNSDSGSSFIMPPTLEKQTSLNKRFTKQTARNTKFYSEGITPIEEEIKIFESNQILKNEVKTIKTETNALNSKDTNDLNSSNKTIFESDSAFIRKMTYNKTSHKKLDSEDVLMIDDYLNKNEK